MDKNLGKIYFSFALFGLFFLQYIQTQSRKEFLYSFAPSVSQLISQNILEKNSWDGPMWGLLEINLKIALGEAPLALVIYNPFLKEYKIVKSKNGLWSPAISQEEIISEINRSDLESFFSTSPMESQRILGHSSNSKNHKFYLVFIQDPEYQGHLFLYSLLFCSLFFFLQFICLNYGYQKKFIEYLVKSKKDILRIEEEKQKKLKDSIVELQETIHQKEDYILHYIKNVNHLGQKIENTNVFLTNAAFEIKAPLKAIISLIHSFHLFTLTPLQNKYLEVIEQSTIILTQIMNGLILSSVKMNLEKDDPHHGSHELIHQEGEIFEIDGLMNTIVSLFAPLFHLKKVELHYEIKPHVSRLLKGNRNQIMQMIINIIDFCYEFCIQKKELSLFVTMQEENSQQYLSFRVEASLFYGKELVANVLEKDLYLLYKYSKKNNAKFTIVEKNKVKMMELLVPIQVLAPEDSDWFLSLAKRKKVTEKKILYIDDQNKNASLIKSYLEYFKITYDFFEDLWLAEKTLTQRHEDYSIVIINTDFHQNSAHDFLKILKQNTKLGSVDFWPIIDLDELDRVNDLKEIGIQRFLTRPVCRDIFFHYLGNVYYESPLSYINHHKNKKVLLVDDCMEDCKIISLYLKNGPIDLKIVHGKESASGPILTEKFDLIITSLELANLFESKENSMVDKIIELRNYQNEPIFHDPNILHRIEKNKNYIKRPIDKNTLLYLLRKRLFHVA